MRWMHMELRKLRHAAILSKHLNFTKAANALNITQSALSRSIQSLEDECQLRLFDRNRNVVNVTAAGRDFLQLAQGLLLTHEHGKPCGTGRRWPCRARDGAAGRANAARADHDRDDRQAGISCERYNRRAEKVAPDAVGRERTH